MRPSAFALVLLATVSAEAAETVPPRPEPVEGATTPAPLSPAEVENLLSAARPQFSPPPEAKPAEEPNTEVLELPKMTVKPRPRPRLGENIILGPKAFNEELAKKNLSTFDRSFLNKFTLPLFGISAADRAREEYNIVQKQQFMSDVMTIARAAEVADPANAKALREAAAKP